MRTASFVWWVLTDSDYEGLALAGGCLLIASATLATATYYIVRRKRNE